MTRRTAIRILRRAFAALTARQRANLRWHAEKGTPVLCGRWAHGYTADDFNYGAEEPLVPPGAA